MEGREAAGCLLVGDVMGCGPGAAAPRPSCWQVSAATGKCVSLRHRATRPRSWLASPALWTCCWAGRWTPSCRPLCGGSGAEKPSIQTLAPTSQLDALRGFAGTSQFDVVHAVWLPARSMAQVLKSTPSAAHWALHRPQLAAAFVNLRAGWQRHAAFAARTIGSLVSDIAATLPPLPLPSTRLAAHPPTVLPAPAAQPADGNGSQGQLESAGKQAAGTVKDVKRLLALLSCISAVARGWGGAAAAAHVAGVQWCVHTCR